MSKKYVACQCNTNPVEPREEIVDSATGEAKVVEGEFVYGPCGAQTKGTFAPGHDARLKGLLLKLIRAGQEFWVRDGGFLVTCDPAEELRNHGWEKFNKPVKARKSAKPKGQGRAAVKAGVKAVEAEEARRGFYPVRVKIGRWVKDANVISESTNSLMVEFTNAKGVKVLQQVNRTQLVEA